MLRNGVTILVAVALTCACQAQIALTKFDVVSIRPSAPGGTLSFEATATGFHARNAPLFWAILEAYFPRPLSYWRDDRLLNAPDWVMNEPFDIDARLDEETAKQFANLTSAERERALRPLLQAMLKERCQAVVQTVAAKTTFYALIAPSHRLKAQMTDTPPRRSIPLPDGGGEVPFTASDGRVGFRFRHVSMPVFAEVLSGFGTTGDLPIEDRTILSGYFDFTLMKQDAETHYVSSRPEDWDLHSLGLSLRRTQGMLPALSLQHIEKPTPN